MLYGLAQVSGDGGFACRGALIPLAAGAGLLASFTAWALRPHRRVTPLIDLRLLRVRSWSVAFTALAVVPAAMLPARRAAAREQGRASQGAAAPRA